MSISALFGATLDRLLPRSCLLCGDRAMAALCPDCLADLPALVEPRCPVCARPLAVEAPACGACLKAPPTFDATFAPLRYAYPVDSLVLDLKFPRQAFGRRLASADFLAARMLAGPRPAGDLIVPVPLSRQRLTERGFNQALEIARPLARALGLPLDAAGLLRQRETVPQSRLPWGARERNVRHAFSASGRFAGKAVIVIDDVMTSGATLDAVAQALKTGGATRVINWVATRALRDAPT